MPHVPDRHADHDATLIAAYAAGDAAGSDLESAAAVVEACGDCASLYVDLRLIASATAALPPPRRVRDFRITEEQAAMLRPTGLRGLLGRLAGPRFSFAAPVGTAMATLGLVGLLAATVPMPLASGPTSQDSTAGGAAPSIAAASIAAAPSAEAAAPAARPAPAEASQRTAGVINPLSASAAPSEAPAASDTALAAESAAPAPSEQAFFASEPPDVASSAAPVDGAVAVQGERDQTAPADGARQQVAASGPSALLLASSVVLAIGLVLLLARLVARWVAGRRLASG